MRVSVDIPQISDDTVVFSWQQDVPNPFQHENHFYFRYEGIDLTRFSHDLFYEIFLGLQLRFFRHMDSEVTVVFPQPVPASSVAFWSAYYELDNVTCKPVRQVSSYSPWSGQPRIIASLTGGIFFGGGKDSTLTAHLFGEIYGSDQVVLINFVAPYQTGQEAVNRAQTRHQDLILAPVRQQSGFATKQVWTDYQSNINYPVRKREQPHFEFFYCGGLPLMLAWDVEFATISIPQTAYYTRMLPDGAVRWHYSASRPEMLEPLSAHFQLALGARVTVTNVNMMFPVLTDYRLLLERYPAAFHNIIMCARGGRRERWCYNCKKCAEYALFGLYYGMVDDRFDYYRFFTGSEYMAEVTATVISPEDRNTWGNAPWRPVISTDNHYLTFCHVVANMRLDQVRDQLSAEALANAAILQWLYGNASFPGVEMTSRDAIGRIENDAASRIIDLVGDQIQITDQLPPPHLAGNREVEYDFSMVMPTLFQEVEHPW